MPERADQVAEQRSDRVVVLHDENVALRPHRLVRHPVTMAALWWQDRYHTGKCSIIVGERDCGEPGLSDRWPNG